MTAKLGGYSATGRGPHGKIGWLLSYRTWTPRELRGKQACNPKMTSQRTSHHARGQRVVDPTQDLTTRGHHESKTSWQGGEWLGHLGRFISFPMGGCFSSPSSPHAWTKSRFFVHKMFIKMVYFKNNTFITLMICLHVCIFSSFFFQQLITL